MDYDFSKMIEAVENSPFKSQVISTDMLLQLLRKANAAIDPDRIDELLDIFENRLDNPNGERLVDCDTAEFHLDHNSRVCLESVNLYTSDIVNIMRGILHCDAGIG